MPVWRSIVLVVGVFWLIAALVLIVGEWLAPALPHAATLNRAGGFDYAGAFMPFVKTYALWAAGILFVLGPLVALRILIGRSFAPGAR